MTDLRHLKICRQCGCESQSKVLVCPMCSEVLPDIDESDVPPMEQFEVSDKLAHIVSGLKRCAACGSLSPAHVVVCECKSVLPILVEGQGAELPVVIDARDCLPEVIAPMLEPEPLSEVLLNVGKAFVLMALMFLVWLFFH